MQSTYYFAECRRNLLFIQDDVKLGPQIIHCGTSIGGGVVVVVAAAATDGRGGVAGHARDEGEKGAERGHKGVRSHGITLHHVQIPMVIFSSAAIHVAASSSRLAYLCSM